MSDDMKDPRKQEVNFNRDNPEEISRQVNKLRADSIQFEQKERVLKNRHLGIFEYLEQLQLEYIIAELRRKIYFSPKDKTYWGRVMVWKKEKIDDIQTRNQVPTIFDDEEVKKDLYHRVYKGGGYPNFIYKDQNDRLVLEDQDRRNYYLKGSKISFPDKFKPERLHTGIIEEVDFIDDSIVISSFKNKLINFKLSDNKITRIL
jgi:hypothetical protein